jgi:hypothetical protein
MARAFRVVSLSFCAVAILAGVVGVVTAIHFAPPRPEGRFAALSLQSTGETARLTRRDLACSADAANPLITRCRATVAGRPLVVTVEHEVARWGFRRCTATLGDRSTPCRSTFPPYAVVDGATLGLTGADIHALRQRDPLGHWREDDWLRAALVLAATLALGIAAGAANAPTSGLLGRIVVAAGSGVTAFFIAYPALGLFVLSLGYVS